MKTVFHIPGSLVVSCRFGGKLTLWACVAVAFLGYTLWITTRSSIDFLESLGMFRSEEIREAIYLDVFQVDGGALAIAFLSLLCVFVLSTLFSFSQYRYFSRLASALSRVADDSVDERSLSSGLGPFRPGFAFLFRTVREQLARPAAERFAGLASSTPPGAWPEKPRPSWLDLSQFILVTLLLGGFFALVAVTLFMKTHARLVDLYPHMTTLRMAGSSHFLASQASAVSGIAWAVFVLIVVSFVATGVTFGRRLGECVYAVSRDLRHFTEGDLDHRVYLRAGDPALLYVESLNESLDKVRARIRK